MSYGEILPGPILISAINRGVNAGIVELLIYI